jgi:hypothetical protein
MTDEPDPIHTTTARERLEMHLAQALTRAESTIVRLHIGAALEECRCLPPTPLVGCPFCGRVGLPERIREHLSVCFSSPMDGR